MQFTGKAIIRVDGNEIRTRPDASLNPGGIKRTPVTDAQGRTGYTEEFVPCELECTYLHGTGYDLMAMNDITNATVIYECDTGQQFVLRDAFTLEPLTLASKEGSAPFKMSALTCEQA